MDKCKREKAFLSEWAKKNDSKYCFPQIDRDAETYYVQRKDDCYIREYNVNTLSDIQDELEDMWHEEYMREIIQIVAISAMKSKPQNEIGGKDNGLKSIENTQEQLKPYIYSF